MFYLAVADQRDHRFGVLLGSAAARGLLRLRVDREPPLRIHAVRFYVDRLSNRTDLQDRSRQSEIRRLQWQRGGWRAHVHSVGIERAAGWSHGHNRNAA